MCMEREFEVGQLVCLLADPDRRGPVIELLPAVGGIPRYRVFHSPMDIREYHADQLLAVEVPSTSDDLEKAIEEHKWLLSSIFQARLTASRLAHPLVDNLYALYSARIKHIPFQFKPMLRFLRADRPRLLIADGVGVGKTIEAGLILKEIQTRQRLDNVLIICPKALVPKWREEMRRFDEDFRPLTSETLQYCLREAYLDGIWPSQYSRAIGHLELLRIEKYMSGTTGRYSRPGLLTLDPPPKFSLLIVDEAHHLRNPGTNSYELARFLCDVSEAVLFLSATPVHVGSDNLFTLLSLLRPDLFPDKSVFAEMVEPNRFITLAMRYLRTREPPNRWQGLVSEALDDVKRTSWGRQVLSLDPRFRDWQQRLHDKKDITDVDRVRCLRDLEEVHSLAHILNRTRRRDIGRFTIREPHTIPVPFTDEQQSFYDALITFRKEILLTQYDQFVVRLIITTLERQAASCLPALVPSLDKFFRSGRFSGPQVSDDPDLDEIFEEIPQYLLSQAQELRSLATNLTLEDPKYDQLLLIIRHTLSEDGPGKVLIFSYFLHTLSYLDRKLDDEGIRVAVITGQVKDEEREYLRTRFRLPRQDENALDVLLSSEVGCEGLDYEFCDRLVNYDIPWNPMRIEQRIGRIDRFGQTSDKVLIFNFITPGTVEERIFFRCFERLGIFRDTVGDLEEVLGDLVQNLTQIALDPTLTPSQAEEKAQQMADNAIRLIEEEHRLEEESGALIGLDQAFVQEVDDLLLERRFVSSTDLRLMIDSFLVQPEFGGRLSDDEHTPNIYRLRLRKESRNILLEKIQEENRYDRPSIEFSRWLQGNDPYFLMTFDQSVALERRDIPFITPVHPLARLAVKHWMAQKEPLVAHIAVNDDTISPGHFLFICDLWETISVKPEIRLTGLGWDISKDCLAQDVSEAIVRLLSKPVKDSVSIDISSDKTNRILHYLDEEANQLRLTALKELRDRNEILISRKSASLDAYHRNRLRRVQVEIDYTTDDRILRMKESEKERIKRDYDIKLQDIESKRAADIITKRIAAGILEVRNDK